MKYARIYPWRRTRRSRAPSNGPDAYFVAQFSAGYTTNMFGFDLRQGQVFDTDRKPDRGIENAYFFSDVSRNAGVGHAGGQAGKRLGAAQTHRQLEDLQRVQEFECGGLAADNVERERGA